MVAFRAISTALAFAAAVPAVLATEKVDFSDNYVQPGQIKPLYKSRGWQFEHFDLLGGVLDAAGNILDDLLGGVLINVGIDLSHGRKKHHWGHPIGVVGGYEGHYNQPGRIYHTSQKPFKARSLKAYCCASDLSKKCVAQDCRIKVCGYDKAKGGNKVYEQEFYIPKSYSDDSGAPIDIDISLDGHMNKGVLGQLLSAITIDIDLLDLVDIDVNNNEKKSKRRGRYSYRKDHNRGFGALVDIDLEL